MRWWTSRRQRREEASTQKARDLREFVYLDEVSVTSLLSSRLGKLPSEFTDTLTSAKKAELNSSAEASAPAIFKSRIGSRYESSWSENTQVLSKATVQATFKRLYDEECESLVLRPVPPGCEAPDTDKIVEALRQGSAHGNLDPWVLDQSTLRRGRLAEVEVELQADPAFRASTIINVFKELADESSEFLGAAGADFDQAIELNRVLEKLMGNLVPLRCRLVDYEAVIGNGADGPLVHARAMEQLAGDQRPHTGPVYLVGVTEQPLFWKDIRRLLFSRARFRVLCRLNYDGLRDAWTPVKLVEVVGEIAPSLEHEMNIFGSGALTAMLEATSTHGKFVEPRVRALITFGERLAEQLDIELTEDMRQEIGALASENADRLTAVAESRKGFTEIATLLNGRYQRELDRVALANLRVSVCRQHGLMPGGSGVRNDTITFPRATNVNDGRFIDAEIVAIYW